MMTVYSRNIFPSYPFMLSLYTYMSCTMGSIEKIHKCKYCNGFSELFWNRIICPYLNWSCFCCYITHQLYSTVISWYLEMIFVSSFITLLFPDIATSINIYVLSITELSFYWYKLFVPCRLLKFIICYYYLRHMV
jgi:hypothetical protein